MREQSLTDAERIEHYVKAFHTRSLINDDDIIVEIYEEISDALPADCPDVIYIRDGRVLYTFHLARYSDMWRKWRTDMQE